MGTVLISLQGLTAYPVSRVAIETLASARGLDVDGTFDADVAKSKPYRLTMADVYMWLVTAPSISQGGISYSFTAAEKNIFLKKAAAIYKELDEESLDAQGVVTYGYKGSSL